MKAVAFIALSGLCTTGLATVQAQYAPDETRIGICDLQNNLNKYDPEYIRIAQAKNAYTLAALQWEDVEPAPGVDDFSALDLRLQEIQEKGRYTIVKLNGNPTNSADKGVFDWQAGSTTATFVHSMNVMDTGLVYRLLDMTNLVSGTVYTIGWDSQTPGPETGDYQVVSNRYHSASKKQLFIQLQVEQHQ